MLNSQHNSYGASSKNNGGQENQIWTIDDVMHPTFKSACYALGLLDGDKEWNDVIKEAEQ